MVFGVTTVGAVAQVPKHHFTQKRCNAVPLCAVEFGVREIVDLIHSFRNHRQQLVQVAGAGPSGSSEIGLSSPVFKSDHPNPRPILATVALLLQEQGEGSQPPSCVTMVFAEPRQRATKPKEGQTAFVVDRLAQELKSYEGSGHAPNNSSKTRVGTTCRKGRMRSAPR